MLALETSIKSVKECIDLLLDNRYIEALEVSGKYAENSLYHSHGHSLLLWFRAYLSLEMPEIIKAQTSTEKTLEFCDSIRPKTLRDNFFVKLFIKTNYEDFNDEEIHAELIRNEQILFSTMMELFVDPSLFALIKVSYRLRNCYLTYKDFSKMIEFKCWNSDLSRKEFVSAVKLGLGVYNLFFAKMPDRVMNMLSIIGYKGSIKEGLKMLNESAFSNTLHSFVSKMVVGAYECYIDQIFNINTNRAPAMERHCESGLQINSHCIWFLVFKGRLNLIDGDIDGALEAYHGSLDLTIDVKQLTNLYLWEITTCYNILGNWSMARHYIIRLRENCPWSLPTFYYMEGCFLYMELETRLLNDDDAGTFLNSADYDKMRSHINTLFSEVPRHVRRYAGRRIPIEKFVCEKVEKYNDEGILISPGYELLLVYNLFIYMENMKQLVETVLAHVDRCQKKFQFDEANESFLLLALLKAVCFRALSRFDDAEPELFKVISKVDLIKRDRYLGPLAMLELGVVKMEQGYYGEARHWLNRCKNDFPSYALELFLQLRLHSAFYKLRILQKQNGVKN